jgi:hypothetical protein
MDNYTNKMDDVPEGCAAEIANIGAGHARFPPWRALLGRPIAQSAPQRHSGSAVRDARRPRGAEKIVVAECSA